MSLQQDPEKAKSELVVMAVVMAVMMVVIEINGGSSKSVEKLSKSQKIVKKVQKLQRSEKFAKAIGSEEYLPKYQL